jgi:excisionase family DNA binding protein
VASGETIVGAADATAEVPGDGARPDGGLNLKQVANLLGVHYMTAYRYVRTGRLPAVKVGSGWVVDEGDVAALLSVGVASFDGPVDWRGRLGDALLAGDEAEAWRVVERALTSGFSPTGCYLELLGGALADIGSPAGATGRPVDDDAAGSYLATATAKRLVARLGARFRRPGRRRGTVVFGAPEGERHDLPIAIVADLVRLEGFTCLELGADVPSSAFAAAALRSDDVVAIGLGVSRAVNLPAAARTIEAVHAVAPDVPVVLGGQGVRNAEVASLIGASCWAPDGAGAVEAVLGLAARR